MDKLKALIVDDEYEQVLKQVSADVRAKYDISTAATGRDALEHISREDVHVILLDIVLPDADGYEICRHIRKIYYQKPLQIIVISGNVEDAYLEKALEVGGDDFIRKPIAPLELQMRLQAAAIRLKSQFALYQEREFYKQAVRQEEELSSRILDQNMLLKRAYQNVENMKRQLEHSNQELKKIARFDVLSGLMNRMSLFDMIDVEMERTVRSNLPLSGIMLDIDHFKNINDNFGHQCGDEVIRMIGRSLKDRLRKYDIAGRYGGEEFFILLPNTPLAQGVQIAERFLGDLRERTVNCDGEEMTITASLGVVQFRVGENRERWIARADRAMYTAKQRGRNMVVSEPG